MTTGRTGIESVSLSPTRRIELRGDEDAILLVDADLPVRRLVDHPLLDRAGPIVHASLDSGDVSLLGRARGRRLFLVDANLQCQEVDLGLERLRHSEHTALHAVRALFVVMTENGVLGLDRAGEERWRIEGTTAGWEFVGIADEALYFSDARQNLIAVDPRTGSEVDP